MCALVGCASGSEVTDVDDDAFVVDDKGDRVARSAAWVRAEVDRWNRHLDAAARAEKYARLAESPFDFFRGTRRACRPRICARTSSTPPRAGARCSRPRTRAATRITTRSSLPYSIDKQVDARAGADRDGFRALVWARASSYARRVAADHAAFASTL